MRSFGGDFALRCRLNSDETEARLELTNRGLSIEVGSLVRQDHTWTWTKDPSVTLTGTNRHFDREAVGAIFTLAALRAVACKDTEHRLGDVTYRMHQCAALQVKLQSEQEALKTRLDVLSKDADEESPKDRSPMARFLGL